jgi:hypothetical protein
MNLPGKMMLEKGLVWDPKRDEAYEASTCWELQQVSTGSLL